MRVLLLGFFGIGVFAACSSFGGDDGETASHAGPAPASTADGSADAGRAGEAGDAGVTAAATDAAPVDLGCPDASLTTDFTTKPGGSFTASSGASFTSDSDATGPFGRFAVAPLADGGVPPDARYFVAIDPNAVHLCVSVRIRVSAPPPEGIVVNELTEVLHGTAGQIGLAGFQAIGSAEATFAGWVESNGSGPGSPSSKVPGTASDWHLTRIELDRMVGTPWRATSIRVDGVERLAAPIEAFPSNGTFASGEIGIGPQAQSAIPANAPVIQVDYADFRFGAK